MLLSAKLLKDRRLFLFLGLILVFYLQFAFGSKIIHFATYLLLALFFYIYTFNVNKAFTYSLIIAFFSESGIGGSLFLMEPINLNPDTGWWFSPLTLILIFLGPLTVFFVQQKTRLLLSDIAVILFLSWLFIIQLFYPFSENIFFAILRITELSVAYFLLRSNLSASDIKNIPLLLVSVLIFHSVLGLIQFYYGRNIGSAIEAVNLTYPYGLTAVEDVNLFRVTATTGHANLFAISIITLLPFMLAFQKYYYFLIGFVYLALILTFSRVAWLIGFVLAVIQNFIYAKSRAFLKLFNRYFLIFFLLMPLILAPLLLTRLSTIPEAFSEGGSWDIRVKVWQEAFNLFVQSPVIGIGPNRFQQLASEQRLTNVFALSGFSPSTKIHNIFLELLTETGLVGFLIFAFFLLTLLYYLIKKRSAGQLQLDFKNILLLSISGLILMSQFHPVFHTAQFRLYYLLAAFILI